jgi:hypothetical protein
MFVQIVDTAACDLYEMEWPHTCPLCWLCCIAQPNRLALAPTQHNGEGLDHSVVHQTPTHSHNSKETHLIQERSPIVAE